MEKGMQSPECELDVPAEMNTNRVMPKTALSREELPALMRCTFRGLLEREKTRG
jgi:hypothetical protein